MNNRTIAALLAAVLAAFTLAPAASAGSMPEPKAVCGISTVSYRFVGTPGTEFRYGRRAYRVPASGSIELIAEKRAVEYQVGERTLPLEVWPKDEFGTRTVPLPTLTASSQL